MQAMERLEAERKTQAAAALDRFHYAFVTFEDKARARPCASVCVRVCAVVTFVQLSRDTFLSDAAPTQPKHN
jgi:hypothetical protein